MRIFSDMDLCEQLGSGMKKILKAYSKDIFDISEHFISVCFAYNKEAVKILDEQADVGVNVGVNGGVKTAEMQLTENAAIVLHIVKQDGTLTQKQIAEQSTLSMRSVQRAIKELKDKKIMVREGSDKIGKYIVLSP
jgi:predicted HTH transcriptional regulator